MPKILGRMGSGGGFRRNIPLLQTGPFPLQRVWRGLRGQTQPKWLHRFHPNQLFPHEKEAHFHNWCVLLTAATAWTLPASPKLPQVYFRKLKAVEDYACLPTRFYRPLLLSWHSYQKCLRYIRSVDLLIANEKLPRNEGTQPYLLTHT